MSKFSSPKNEHQHIHKGDKVIVILIIIISVWNEKKKGRCINERNRKHKHIIDDAGRSSEKKIDAKMFSLNKIIQNISYLNNIIIIG